MTLLLDLWLAYWRATFAALARFERQADFVTRERPEPIAMTAPVERPSAEVVKLREWREGGGV